MKVVEYVCNGCGKNYSDAVGMEKVNWVQTYGYFAPIGAQMDDRLVHFCGPCAGAVTVTATGWTISLDADHNPIPVVNQ